MTVQNTSLQLNDEVEEHFEVLQNFNIKQFLPRSLSPISNLVVIVQVFDLAYGKVFFYNVQPT